MFVVRRALGSCCFSILVIAAAIQLFHPAETSAQYFSEESDEPEFIPTPEPTAEPTPEPTAEPTAEPTPESTPEPTAEPTPEPTAEPTPEPTPEPTAEPTPEPTAEPTPPEFPPFGPPPEQYFSDTDDGGDPLVAGCVSVYEDNQCGSLLQSNVDYDRCIDPGPPDPIGGPGDRQSGRFLSEVSMSECSLGQDVSIDTVDCESFCAGLGYDSGKCSTEDFVCSTEENPQGRAGKCVCGQGPHVPPEDPGGSDPMCKCPLNPDSGERIAQDGGCSPTSAPICYLSNCWVEIPIDPNAPYRGYRTPQMRSCVDQSDPRYPESPQDTFYFAKNDGGNPNVAGCLRQHPSRQRNRLRSNSTLLTAQPGTGNHRLNS